MQQYKIVRSDLVVSRLAYGVGMFGSKWQSNDYFSKASSAIRTAYENGINFFDTADVYAGGAAEQALGEFIASSRAIREHIVIQTKCGLHVNPEWEPGKPISSAAIRVDLRHQHLVSAVEGSLRRLSTDRIDVLLLHAPSALMQPSEIARAFDELRAAGKVLHFGVSGFNAVQIELLRKSIDVPLVANQIWVGLGHCAPIAEQSGYGGIVDYCRLHDIQVQAFSPLKNGSIFDPPALLAPPSENSGSAIDQLARALHSTATIHATTPAAIMLAWLLRHPAGIVPIIGAANPSHIAGNCVADEIPLSNEEWQTLLAMAL